MADSRSLHKCPGGRQPAVLVVNVCTGPAHDILLPPACAEMACAVWGWPHQSTASNIAASWHLLGLQSVCYMAGRWSQWSCRLLDWDGETGAGRICRPPHIG